MFGARVFGLKLGFEYSSGVTLVAKCRDTLAAALKYLKHTQVKLYRVVLQLLYKYLEHFV